MTIGSSVDAPLKHRRIDPGFNKGVRMRKVFVETYG
jgi:hypothetical protein